MKSEQPSEEIPVQKSAKLKQLIWATQVMTGKKLYLFLLEKIKQTDFTIQDLKEISIDEEKSKEMPYCAPVYIPIKPNPLTSNQIKSALLASLLLPLEILNPKSDILFIQMYENVQIQQIYSAQYGSPVSIDTLTFLISYMEREESSFGKIAKKYEQRIEQENYEVIYLPREEKSIQTLYKSKKIVYDFSIKSESTKYLQRLLGIREQFLLKLQKLQNDN